MTHSGWYFSAGPGRRQVAGCRRNAEPLGQALGLCSLVGARRADKQQAHQITRAGCAGHGIPPSAIELTRYQLEQAGHWWRRPGYRRVNGRTAVQALDLGLAQPRLGMQLPCDSGQPLRVTF